MTGARTLALVLLGLAACVGDDPRGDEVEAEDSTGELESDVCTDACLDTESEAGIALCHSCRCKAAFDDWLPSADELQCENGVPIVTYHAELSDTDFVLEPGPISPRDCANPSLLTSSCRQGSKLGHLVHDDVEVYWICRDPLLDLDGSVLYEDMAAIGHNRRTGATCFWDDVNNHTHDDDVPPFDLIAATEDDRDRFVERFSYVDGSGCVVCHDHDPFVYTPHLQSTDWQTIADDKGPYHLVSLDGEPSPTGVRHLVSPEAAACTGCHRLGNKNSCSFFAPDALGAHKVSAYEDAVHDAMDPNSPYWELAYWMPPAAAPDFAAWHDTFATARDHILSCCESPGVDSGACQWASVPAN